MISEKGNYPQSGNYRSAHSEQRKSMHKIPARQEECRQDNRRELCLSGKKTGDLACRGPAMLDPCGEEMVTARRCGPWRSGGSSGGKGIFVGAGAVDGRHGDIEKAQVNRKLAAVVVDVIQHHGSDEANARDGHQRFAVHLSLPVGHERGVILFLKTFLARAVLSSPENS